MVLTIRAYLSRFGYDDGGKPIDDPSSIFFMLEGCHLAATKGEEASLKHFEPLLETTFPSIPSLLGHFLKGTIDIKGPWFHQAFLWEKFQLYRQLIPFPKNKVQN